MPVTLHFSDEDFVRSATRAIRLLDAKIGTSAFSAILNPLTTVQTLIDALNALTRIDAQFEYDVRMAVENVARMRDLGILGTADVTAGNTAALLIASINTNSGVAAEEQDLGFADGGEIYLGNTTEATV